MSIHTRFSLTLCAVLSACRGDAPAPPVTELGLEPSASAERSIEDGLYERNVVFMTVDADSAIVVPWFFRTSTSEEGVERLSEGWLARAGLWEPFFHVEWSGEPTRTPFRIQPRGPMDLIIGAGGTLERILFAEGQRQLEVVIDEGVSDWSRKSRRNVPGTSGRSPLRRSTGSRTRAGHESSTPERGPRARRVDVPHRAPAPGDRGRVARRVTRLHGLGQSGRTGIPMAGSTGGVERGEVPSRRRAETCL